VFFHSQQWGVFRQVKLVTVQQVNSIPVPNFTETQVEKLAKLHDFIVKYERNFIVGLSVDFQGHLFEGKRLTEQEIMQRRTAEIIAFRQRMKTFISNIIFRMFQVPKDLRTIITDFIDTKLLLDKASAVEDVISDTSKKMLRDYGRQLRDDLDAFSLNGIRHKVSIWKLKHLVQCKVELLENNDGVFPVEVHDVNDPDLSRLVSIKMKHQFSQWIYVSRSIRVFQNSKALIVKPRRVIDWTKTQAMIDAGDFIGEALRLS
jgi:hypothetical protein